MSTAAKNIVIRMIYIYKHIIQPAKPVDNVLCFNDSDI